MRSLRRPSAEALRIFLERERGLDFSYPEVGASRAEAPPGYDLDRNRVHLGNGRAVFERAAAALQEWRMFPAGWSLVESGGAPPLAGQTVAVVFRVLGLWWWNAARVVYVLDEREPVRRIGFAYGTLPGHVEQGEERFSVEWLADDSVWYDLLAFSRPRYWGARLAKPVARSLQRRFVQASPAAMRAAARGEPNGAPRP